MGAQGLVKTQWSQVDAENESLRFALTMAWWLLAVGAAVIVDCVSLGASGGSGADSPPLCACCFDRPVFVGQRVAQTNHFAGW